MESARVGNVTLKSMKWKVLADNTWERLAKWRSKPCGHWQNSETVEQNIIEGSVSTSQCQWRLKTWPSLLEDSLEFQMRLRMKWKATPQMNVLCGQSREDIPAAYTQQGCTHANLYVVSSFYPRSMFCCFMCAGDLTQVFKRPKHYHWAIPSASDMILN
jgi:hypothetical protein